MPHAFYIRDQCAPMCCLGSSAIREALDSLQVYRIFLVLREMRLHKHFQDAFTSSIMQLLQHLNNEYLCIKYS